MTLEQQTLYALFCLSRDTQHISASTLADALSCTPTRAAAALVALERAGLCDATRARLTMLGLATAARLGSAQGGGPRRLPRVQRSAPRRREVPLPVAAAPASVGGDGAMTSPLA